MRLLAKVAIFYYISIGISSSFAQDCSELKTECEYYLCIEAKKKCGDKGYLKSFGYKYCSKFSNRQESYFSALSQHWIQKTKICLIDSIDILDPNLSCRSFKKAAFKQHTECYVSSGFCALPRKDKGKILKTIAFELLKPRTIISGVGIVKSCLSRREQGKQ
jgi:hypothetical protein